MVADRYIYISNSFDTDMEIFNRWLKSSQHIEKKDNDT